MKKMLILASFFFVLSACREEKTSNLVNKDLQSSDILGINGSDSIVSLSQESHKIKIRNFEFLNPQTSVGTGFWFSISTVAPKRIDQANHERCLSVRYCIKSQGGCEWLVASTAETLSSKEQAEAARSYAQEFEIKFPTAIDRGVVIEGFYCAAKTRLDISYSNSLTPIKLESSDVLVEQEKQASPLHPVQPRD